MTLPSTEEFRPRPFAGLVLRAQPDRRLVALVREGYETAFGEIVRRYDEPLRRYAAAIVGGRSEDVTQDAFAKALLSLRHGESEIELRPWLYRIVRNTALNDLRTWSPTPEIPADSVAGGLGPAEAFEQRESLTELMVRVQALPAQQRAAIVMQEFEGVGQEEIAAALGLTGGAVRQAIYRARRALRDGLGMLIPLPLLRSALVGGAGPVEAATGGAGAAASLALKATVATMLVAGVVGAGAAMHSAAQVAGPAANLRPQGGRNGHHVAVLAVGGRSADRSTVGARSRGGNRRPAGPGPGGPEGRAVRGGQGAGGSGPQDNREGGGPGPAGSDSKPESSAPPQFDHGGGESPPGNPSSKSGNGSSDVSAEAESDGYDGSDGSGEEQSSDGSWESPVAGGSEASEPEGAGGSSNPSETPEPEGEDGSPGSGETPELEVAGASPGPGETSEPEAAGGSSPLSETPN